MSKERKLGEDRYWICIIGPVNVAKLPDGGDGPPRAAAIAAVEGMNCEVENCWSGWGADGEIVARVEKEWDRRAAENGSEVEVDDQVQSQ